MRVLYFILNLLAFSLLSFFSYGAVNSPASKTIAYACSGCSYNDFISVAKKEVPSKKCKFTTPKGEVPQEEDWVCYKQSETMIIADPIGKNANKFIVNSADDYGDIEIKSIPLTPGEKNDLEIFYRIDNSFRQLSTNSIVIHAEQNKTSQSNEFIQFTEGEASNSKCKMSPFPTDFLTSNDYKHQVFNELASAMKQSIGNQAWVDYIDNFDDVDVTGVSLGLTEIGMSFNHNAVNKIFVHVLYDYDGKLVPDNRLTFSVTYGGTYFEKGKKRMGFHFKLEPDLSFAGKMSIGDLSTPSGSDNSVRFNGDNIDPCLVEYFERNKTKATTQTHLSGDEIYGHWEDVISGGSGIQICRFSTSVRGYAGYGCGSNPKEYCNPQDIVYEYMGICN